MLCICYDTYNLISNIFCLGSGAILKYPILISYNKRSDLLGRKEELINNIYQNGMSVEEIARYVEMSIDEVTRMVNKAV